MVLFDIPFAALAAGVVTRRSGRDRPGPALALAALGIVPTGVAFLVTWPAWDWQYLIDPASTRLDTPAIFVVAVMLSACFGAWIGPRRPLWLVPIALGLIVFNLFHIDGLLHVGTLAEYRAGTAPIFPWAFVRFTIPWLIWSGVVFGACWWWAGRLPASGQRDTLSGQI